MQRRDALSWLVLGAAALLPRLAGAAVRQPWHDEYYTVWAAGLPFHDLLAALRLDSGPPLPYLLTGLLAHAGIGALAAARGIAVAAGVAAVLVAAAAARRAFGASAGWWAGALLAAHPLAVAWSSEGRAYSLLLLAAALAWERLEALRATGRGAVGLAAAIALACWSHGLGLVLLGAVALAAATLADRPRRYGLAATAAGAAAFLPWLPVAVGQPGAATAWMIDAWRSLAWTTRAVASVRLLPPLAGFGSALDLPSATVLLQLAAAACCLALFASARFRAIPVVLFVLPALALPVLATIGVPAFYAGRGEALFLAPALGLVASGASRHGHRRWLAAVLVAASVAVVTAAIRNWEATPPSREEVVAAAVVRSMPDGGTVVTSGYWWLDLWYHLDRRGERFEMLAFPRDAGRHPGWYSDTVDAPKAGELDRLAADLTARMPAVAVIVTPGLTSAAPLRRLAGHFGLRRSATVTGGELYLPSSPLRDPAADRPPDGGS